MQFVEVSFIVTKWLFIKGLFEDPSCLDQCYVMHHKALPSGQDKILNTIL